MRFPFVSAEVIADATDKDWLVLQACVVWLIAQADAPPTNRNADGFQNAGIDGIEYGAETISGKSSRLTRPIGIANVCCIG